MCCLTVCRSIEKRHGEAGIVMEIAASKLSLHTSHYSYRQNYDSHVDNKKYM